MSNHTPNKLSRVSGQPGSAASQWPQLDREGTQPPRPTETGLRL